MWLREAGYTVNTGGDELVIPSRVGSSYGGRSWVVFEAKRDFRCDNNTAIKIVYTRALGH